MERIEELEAQVKELDRKYGVTKDLLDRCIMTTDNRYGVQGKLDIFDGYFECIHKRLTSLENSLKEIKIPTVEIISQEVAKLKKDIIDSLNKVIEVVPEKKKK